VYKVPTLVESSLHKVS